MQSFEISHIFETDRDEYLAVIDGSEFVERLVATLGLRERSIAERRDCGDHELVRLRVVPTADLPGPVRAALGGKGMSYYEEEVRPKDRPYHREWKVLLDALPASRFRCEGTFDLEPVGASQVRRVMRGQVEVKLFGVGGIVETHVRRGIEESYVKTTELVRQMLAERAALR